MAKAAKKERFKVVYSEVTGLSDEAKVVLIDLETGVNYLFVRSGYAGGLTPLLDENGKPVITEVDAEDKGFFE